MSEEQKQQLETMIREIVKEELKDKTTEEVITLKQILQIKNNAAKKKYHYN